VESIPSSGRTVACRLRHAITVSKPPAGVPRFFFGQGDRRNIRAYQYGRLPSRRRSAGRPHEYHEITGTIAAGIWRSASAASATRHAAYDAGTIPTDATDDATDAADDAANAAHDASRPDAHGTTSTDAAHTTTDADGDDAPGSDADGSAGHITARTTTDAARRTANDAGAAGTLAATDAAANTTATTGAADSTTRSSTALAEQVRQ